MTRYEFLGGLGFGIAAAILIAANGMSAQKLPHFAHAKHMEEAGSCDVCHAPEANDTAKPRLKRGACGDCHDSYPTYDRGNFSEPMSIEFPHKKHSEAFDCADCHKPTIKDTQSSRRPLLTHKSCFDCHEENGVEIGPSDCRPCHGKSTAKIRPKSHGANVVARHGREAKWRVSMGHGGDCYSCHSRGECTRCHLSRRPKDHTGLWRVRMHGFEAAWNRDRCRTCHETGVCTHCHRTTRPMNHKGMWRSIHGLTADGRTDKRCGVCHEASWCVRCHMGRGRR